MQAEGRGSQRKEVAMKRWILFLTALFIMHSFYQAPAVSAQQEETQRIKNELQEYYAALARGDLETMMQKVSLDYENVVDGRPVDRGLFRERLKKLIEQNSQKYRDYAIGEVAITNVTFQADNAIVGIEFNWKGYNLEKQAQDSGSLKRSFVLKKEEGAWKIIKSSRL